MNIWLAISIGSLAWLLSLILAGLLGFRYYQIKRRVGNLEKKLKNKIITDKPPAEPPKPESSIIDPTDIRELAQFEQDEIQRKLNP